MANIIDKFAERPIRMWSDEEISNKQQELQKRRKELPLYYKVLGGAAFVGAVAGLAVGMHDRLASTPNETSNNPTAWISNSVSAATERANDILNPSNFETFGSQTVIAEEGDNINILAEHVRGWGNLTPEQFILMVNQIEASNGIENNESLIAGMAVEMPESVK